MLTATTLLATFANMAPLALAAVTDSARDNGPRGLIARELIDAAERHDADTPFGRALVLAHALRWHLAVSPWRTPIRVGNNELAALNTARRELSSAEAFVLLCLDPRGPYSGYGHSIRRIAAEAVLTRHDAHGDSDFSQIAEDILSAARTVELIPVTVADDGTGRGIALWETDTATACDSDSCIYPGTYRALLPRRTVQRHHRLTADHHGRTRAACGCHGTPATGLGHPTPDTATYLPAPTLIDTTTVDSRDRITVIVGHHGDHMSLAQVDSLEEGQDFAYGDDRFDVTTVSRRVAERFHRLEALLARRHAVQRAEAAAEAVPS